jgi:hypothetical protein
MKRQQGCDYESQGKDAIYGLVILFAIALIGAIIFVWALFRFPFEDVEEI